MPYDPLTASLAPNSQDYIESYWRATAGTPPPDEGQLDTDVNTDVAIIGGGYTGLSCAYYLAKKYGIRAHVLEANRPGWGCSGRNGSFIRPAIGRMTWQGCIDRWGVDKARQLFAESHRALSTMRELITSGPIDCEQQPDGWLKVAHLPSRVAALEREQRLLAEVFDYQVDLLDSDALRKNHFTSNEAYAALRFPEAFCAHPLKLAFGLVKMGKQAGAYIHSNSPVTSWSREEGGHRLQTPRGTVFAKHVVIATNGYSTEKLHACLVGRLIPVLSNIIVTRPLTQTELQESAFFTTDIITDTRKILNYYRRLPDGRVLLGSRGAVQDSAKENTEIMRALSRTLKHKFPALRDIVADYHWGGWVALSMDAMPRVHSPVDDHTVYYGIGYNGSGTSASVHAGRIIAERLGEGKPILDILDSPLPRVPLAALRRLGQRSAYLWYRYQDSR